MLKFRENNGTQIYFNIILSAKKFIDGDFDLEIEYVQARQDQLGLQLISLDRP